MAAPAPKRDLPDVPQDKKARDAKRQRLNNGDSRNVRKQDLPWMTTASSQIPFGSGQDYAPNKRPAFADSSNQQHLRRVLDMVKII